MFSWVTSTLVQGEFGGKQTRQCGLAQSAKPVGGVTLWHEVGRQSVTSLTGPYSASGPEVANVREVHFVQVGHERFGQQCGIYASHPGRSIPRGIPTGAITRSFWSELCSVPATVFNTRTKFSIPGNRTTRENSRSRYHMMFSLLFHNLCHLPF